MTDEDKLTALALIEADMDRDPITLQALLDPSTAGAWPALLNIASWAIRELAHHLDAEPRAVTAQLRANIIEGELNHE